uniref:AGO914 n=1 Tax=Arundo donax TaxID=35708 RepID=A0A0A8Y8Y0_ARUDO
MRLRTNHFKVSVDSTDAVFYHYHVNLKYDDGQPVKEKGVGRKVVDKLLEIYASDLANMKFAYDGEKSLITIGALLHVRMSSL